MEKEIIEFEKLINEVDQELSNEFLKIAPINIEAEKKKFFSKSNYNPIFKYKQIKISPLLIQKLLKLSNTKLPSNPLSNALIAKAYKLKQYAQLISSIGTNTFSNISNEIYNLPSKKLISQAKLIIKKNYSEKDEFVQSDKAVSISKECLAKFELNDWKVKYGQIVSLAMVQSSTKTIFVKKNVLVSKNFLKRMIVHEIGTHVFRSINGKNQPYIIFSNGFADYLETEEGLATNIEEMHHCLDNKTLKIYAARVLAVDTASRSSFCQTYKELRKYLNEEDAWQVTLRVKRGLKYSNDSGCYPKDYLYLKGYYSVKKYILKNGNDGIKKLYHGKISLSDLDLLEKLPDLKKPKLLPTDKKLRELVRKI